MIILLAATAFDASVYYTNYDNTNTMVDWIYSVGVFVGLNQNICNKVPKKPASIRSIFDNLYIIYGDLLFNIPWKETLYTPMMTQGKILISVD